MRKHLAISAVAIVSLGAIAVPASAERKPHVRTIELRDSCDPATFNAAFGDGVCAEHPGKKVTVPKFLAAIDPVKHVGHRDWNFKPDHIDIHSGDVLKAVVRGGEFHTFSEVTAFGAGCFPPLNDLLGLVPPDFNMPADEVCGAFFNETGVFPPGAPAPFPTSLNVENLSPGTHLFMCEIHPWMQTTVTVKSD